MPQAGVSLAINRDHIGREELRNLTGADPVLTVELDEINVCIIEWAAFGVLNRTGYFDFTNERRSTYDGVHHIDCIRRRVGAVPPVAAPTNPVDIVEVAETEPRAPRATLFDPRPPEVPVPAPVIDEADDATRPRFEENTLWVPRTEERAGCLCAVLIFDVARVNGVVMTARGHHYRRDREGGISGAHQTYTYNESRRMEGGYTVLAGSVHGDDAMRPLTAEEYQIWVGGMLNDGGVRVVPHSTTVARAMPPVEVAPLPEGVTMVSVGEIWACRNGHTAHMTREEGPNVFADVYHNALRIGGIWFQKALDGAIGHIIDNTDPGWDLVRRMCTVEEAEQRKSRARIGYWDGADSTAFKRFILDQARDVLWPHVRVPILINVPHGRAASPVPADAPEFVVHIWSGPITGTSDFAPERMWGLGPPSRDRGSFLPFVDGTEIETDEGDIIGAVNERNLYVYFDMVHQETSNARELWRKICDVAVKLLRGELTQPTAEECRAKYVELCQGRSRKQIEAAQAFVTSKKSEIEKWQKTLVDTVREMRSQETWLFGASERSKSDMASFSKEYDMVLKTPHVKRARFRGESFDVETDTIYVLDPRPKGKMHEIGSFRIKIHTGNCKVVIIRRQGLGPNNMMAPHVGSQGNPCWGTLASTIPQLIAEYELSAVVQLIISYLESVNVDDAWGNKIAHWPAAPESMQPKAAVAAPAPETLAAAATPAEQPAF